MAKKWKVIIAIFVGLVIVGMVTGEDEPVEKEEVNNVDVIADEKKDETKPGKKDKDEKGQAKKKTEKDEPEAEEETSDMTVSQENAIRKAESYLDFTAFSKSGLIDQLEYEGYPTEEAEFAVENIEVNWKEQAVNSAESYMSHSAFSRQGLVDQLIFEGHSEEHANHAADQVGL